MWAKSDRGMGRLCGKGSKERSLSAKEKDTITCLHERYPTGGTGTHTMSIRTLHALVM